MQEYRIKTELILLKLGLYVTTLTFDITIMNRYDAVLGIP
jgi:hypothetical protein